MSAASLFTRSVPARLLGKEFGPGALQAVREIISQAVPNTRAEIARRVCQQLHWHNARGQLQLMSARVGLLRLHRLRLIRLPPARNGNGNGKWQVRTACLWPEVKDLHQPVQELTGLRLVPIENRDQSQLWSGLVGRYHYLGYRPLPGAQKRYLIAWDQGWIGAIGFGASAWKIAPRDHFIGWHDALERENHLHLVINNWRFLILPWVHCPNLASKILSLCAQQVPEDFHRTYGYRPVLMESFVERDRFEGISYRAANWICVGQTQGRGRMDRKRLHRLPVKDIWLYPLTPDWREILVPKHRLTEEQGSAEIQTELDFACR